MINPLDIKKTEHGNWLRSLTLMAQGLYTFTTGATSIDVLLRIQGYPFLVTDTTVAAGGTDSINFTGALGSHPLYAILFDIAPETDAVECILRTGAGGSYSSGASDYLWASYFAASDTGTGNQVDAADSEIRLGNSIGNAAGEHISGLVLIPMPSGTTYAKRAYGVTGSTDSGAVELGRFFSGRRAATTAITDVQLLFDSGQVAADSRASLYAFPGTE